MKLPALILTTLITFGSAGAVQAETFDFDNSNQAETTLAQGFFRNILHHKARHHRRHHSNRRHHGNRRRVYRSNRRHHQPYRSHQRRQNTHHQNHGQHHGGRRVNYYR